MKVLCVGAHPDDVEIGCGGTILRHKAREDHVTIVVMSGTPIRRREAIEASKILGVDDIKLAGFTDTMIPEGVEAVTVLDKIINELKPERIYTHTPKDTHQDHRSVALATLSAGRRSPQILFFESAPPKSWSFTPNYYVDISKYIEKKIKAIRLFKSQADKWYMNPNVLRNMAGFRGVEIGTRYAEAFEVYKILEV